jgi:dihydrofolate reductase
MQRPALSLIAAVARNGAIGRDNALIWLDPEDQRHFRRVTMGWPVIMGRRTWESLPARFRPLPGRRNVVLTGDANWQAPGAERAGSLPEALDLLAGSEKACVIGGAKVYSEALPLADELVLTEIEFEPAADTYFPAWDRRLYTERARESHTSADGVAYHFVTYTRNRGD